jgi:hypothetical protein
MTHEASNANDSTLHDFVDAAGSRLGADAAGAPNVDLALEDENLFTKVADPLDGYVGFLYRFHVEQLVHVLEHGLTPWSVLPALRLVGAVCHSTFGASSSKAGPRFCASQRS